MMDHSNRSHRSKSDMNNNEIISTSPTANKKRKTIPKAKEKHLYTIGQIKEVQMTNFMCHKNFSIEFHPTPMQIVTGANGSGKSTIANAICLCLGAQARATGRTSNVQSFIRNGETYAQLTITLANEGPEAYKPELYGKEIQIIRKIGAKQSSYKVLSINRKVISTQKETIAEIIQALSISPENPLCILHQETAKTFLLNSDAKKKYQFYMKVSQLDQIKQAYEDSVCIVHSIRQRINGMKQRHDDILREMKPFEQEIKKIEDRRDKETKKHELELELRSARNTEAQQELVDAQNVLDETQKSKDITEAKITEINKGVHELDQRIEDLNTEKQDLEKDLNDANGIRELKYRFSKQKQEIDLLIYRLSRECENYHRILEEREVEKDRLKKQIDEYQTLSQQTNHNDQERERFENELHIREQQQNEFDKNLSTLTEDLNLTNENIRKNQSTLSSIQNELRRKQQEYDELKRIDRGQVNVYGPWMSDCLKAIEEDDRFHKKPIGPIGRYIRCTEARWAYAVEKHLAPIMSAFICSNRHDERILLELFSIYATDQRPTIFVRKYSDRVHDVSGTLECVRRANLLSIYQVLKIENVTVECALIDYKQIEATILVEDFQQAKRIRSSAVLRWKPIHNRVKQVSEAWTYDGSNIKLDKAFRIYTNDKQPARYFTSNNTQALSLNELETEINRLQQEINQVHSAINQLTKTRQTTTDNIEKIKRSIHENKRKIKDLNKEVEQLNSTMPVTYADSIDELKEKLNECMNEYNKANEKFEQVKNDKEIQHQYFADIKQKLENIDKKFEGKTQERDNLIEKITLIQTQRQQLQQQIPKLTKKFAQLNEDILKYQEKLNVLTKNQPKKSKTSKTTIRSVRNIQQELDGINRYLQSYEDTKEKRLQIIDEFKIKRDKATALKKLHDHCLKQLQRLDTFVNKRKERFGQIADRHEYLLRHKFRDLMDKHKFDDCDIQIDHRKEELEIIIKKNQRSVASLSGGERSISTFCFLLALWGSIYQPFRLLDEIDIYMDNEKRNSSLELLYENTQYYSSSQHVIFTPQAIDGEVWKKLNVPVFFMPTPKRSFQ